MTTSITKDTMTDTVIKEETPTEFGSMQLKEYITLIDLMKSLEKVHNTD